MKMSNKVYNVLKWIVITVLPGIATLYSGLAVLWGFPYGEEIVGTVSLITVFLGSLIGVSSVKYNKTINAVSVDTVE